MCLQPPLRDEDENGNVTLVEWMTKAKIQETALEPSIKWVETGHAEEGTVHLEIIGCDNLPSMDLNSLADPFAGIVFEDAMVRTKVLFETLNPRFMPWSMRAFGFKVSHPGSMLFLGVFDCDEDLAIADFHDPVGRIVINTINFESGVTHLLHCDLMDSSQISQHGKLTL